MKDIDPFDDRKRGPVLSARFVVALALMVLGIAWIAYYYVAVRPDPTVLDSVAGSPAFMADLVRWNYVIGFGLFFLGLAASWPSASPSPPDGNEDASADSLMVVERAARLRNEAATRVSRPDQVC